VQCMNQPLGTRRGPAPPVFIRIAEAASAPSKGLPRVDLAAGIERSARGSVVVSAMGNDPSVGEPTRVYITVVNSQAEMDRALCPDGMTNEDRSRLYNNMINITASPGKSKHSDSAASTYIAMLAQL
jgi:hypothetical protein